MMTVSTYSVRSSSVVVVVVISCVAISSLLRVDVRWRRRLDGCARPASPERTILASAPNGQFQLHEAVLERERSRRGAGRDAELREDVLQVPGDGVLAEHELRGDLTVALPGRDQA